jgi:hypothetical protein
MVAIELTMGGKTILTRLIKGDREDKITVIR